MTPNLNATCSSVNKLCIESRTKALNNPCMKEINKRLDLRLSEMGWKPTDLAKAMNTTDQRVYNWRVRGVPGTEAPNIARALGVTTDWLLTGSEPKFPQKMTAKNTAEANASYLPAEFAPWDSNTPLGEDEVEVPFYTEVLAAAGAGTIVQEENSGPKLRFSRSGLKRAGVDPENAACVRVQGNSMEPVLPDGTTIGVNTADTAIKDGKMYAIDQEGMLRVKLLYRLPGNGLRLRSYNADEWPEETMRPDEADRIRVIGRVFWYSVLL